MAIRKIIKYYPKQDRLVVLQDPSETISEGGIIIPETAREKVQKGTIIEKGFDVDPRIGDVGDKIVFAKYAGSEIEWHGSKSGDTYLLLRENDVSATIREFEIDDEVIDPITLKEIKK